MSSHPKGKRTCDFWTNSWGGQRLEAEQGERRMCTWREGSSPSSYETGFTWKSKTRPSKWQGKTTIISLSCSSLETPVSTFYLVYISLQSKLFFFFNGALQETDVWTDTSSTFRLLSLWASRTIINLLIGTFPYWWAGEVLLVEIAPSLSWLPVCFRIGFSWFLPITWSGFHLYVKEAWLHESQRCWCCSPRDPSQTHCLLTACFYRLVLKRTCAHSQLHVLILAVRVALCDLKLKLICFLLYYAQFTQINPELVPAQMQGWIKD